MLWKQSSLFPYKCLPFSIKTVAGCDKKNLIFALSIAKKKPNFYFRIFKNYFYIKNTKSKNSLFFFKSFKLDNFVGHIESVLIHSSPPPPPSKEGGGISGFSSAHFLPGGGFCLGTKFFVLISSYTCSPSPSILSADKDLHFCLRFSYNKFYFNSS